MEMEKEEHIKYGLDSTSQMEKKEREREKEQRKEEKKREHKGQHDKKGRERHACYNEAVYSWP